MDRTGYPKLADYVALEPQLAIFKRFGALNAENLYYMQAEIASLEEELRQIIADDTKSRDRKVQKFSSSWRILQAAGGNSAQWQKRMEIRVRLKEYNEALLQCVRLQQIDPADERDLNTLNEWLWDREDGGRAFLHDDSVKGPEYDASTKDLYEEAKDLIPLAPRPGEKDAFTRFLMGPLLEFLNDKFLYRLRGNGSYSNTTLVEIADTIVTVAACLLLVISTIVLYFIHSTIARLGVVAAFIMVFAVMLKVFTKGSRIDILAAAAAFASVQVVFIGTTST
ncbi:MAG: hypothetical protein HETSPECPRED_007158 [Heterodermia speciosa]|uniref:DUF6594 domain-containing protein n=1 Tax=Heterodermia speciosa TaxID=116794 RepID=A0A8H3I8T4_9LECA|nr:MAG: hypothetical protein HETSPECPRED_007158 [Heterodermia speciosa]